MATTFAIVNQKGGVGKTTSSVNIADLFAADGYSTLIVDLDSQGNVADCLGLEAGNDLFRLLSPDLGLTLADVVCPSGRPNLDVVRSDKSTAQISSPSAMFILADKLDGAPYDVIVIDSAPSVETLQPAALLAADFLLIPTRLEQLAVKGVREALQSLNTVKRASRCQLAGIIPTFYEKTTTETYEQLLHLVQVFKQTVYPPIPMDTKCRTSTRFGQTLREFAPASRALVGIPNGNGAVGGYIQVVEKLKDLL